MSRLGKPLTSRKRNTAEPTTYTNLNSVIGSTNSVTKSVTAKFALAQVETVTEHVSSLLTVTLPSGAQVEGIDEHNAHVAVKLIECMS